MIYLSTFKQKFWLEYHKVSTHGAFCVDLFCPSVLEDDPASAFPVSGTSSIRSQFSEIGNSFAEDREADGMCHLYI